MKVRNSSQLPFFEHFNNYVIIQIFDMNSGGSGRTGLPTSLFQPLTVSSYSSPQLPNFQHSELNIGTTGWCIFYGALIELIVSVLSLIA